MTENLLRKPPPKTTRERDPERRSEDRVARSDKGNGWPRYRPHEMPRFSGAMSGGTAERVNALAPKFGREFFYFRRSP
jgi:hypothetical protein